MLRPKIRLMRSGRPRSRLSRMTCSKKIRPETGLSSIWLGEGELGLADGDVVAVAGRPVCGAERVRQPCQAFTAARGHLDGAQEVADRLQSGGVLEGGEAVVQRGEGEVGLGGLAFGPVVAVDAQLGVEGEVAAELEEERAEVSINAVEVEVVDHPG